MPVYTLARYRARDGTLTRTVRRLIDPVCSIRASLNVVRQIGAHSYGLWLGTHIYRAVENLRYQHPPAGDDPVESLFAGLADRGGQMGERIRQYDWAGTPLGPVSGWSQGLRMALRLCLGSKVATCIYWGADHIMLYNNAHLGNLGLKHPWALGQPVAKVWPEVYEPIHALFRTCLTTGESLGAEDRFWLLSRSDLREEIYSSFSYAPLSNEFGRIEAVYATIFDTSRRVVSERRLRTLQNLGASDHYARSPEAALVAAGAVVAMNPYDVPFAAMYLWDDARHEARLCAVSNTQPGMSGSPRSIRLGDAGVLADLAALSGGKRLEVREFLSELQPLPTGAWESPPSRIVMLPLPASTRGAPEGFIIAGTNPHARFDQDYRRFLQMLGDQISGSLAEAYVSQQEGARAKALAELDHAKTTFFNNVSHELRTPLTLLLGLVEEMVEGADGPLTGEQQSSLSVVRRNGLLLLKLVNGLLDFARIEANRLHASFEPVNLRAITTQLASSFEWVARKAAIRFVVDCEELDELVYVDRDMWEKIVLNLLSNAFKFTLSGEIRVALRRRADAAELSVIDTGVGIPKHELARIFERFHRVEGPAGRSREGAGIGLALVKELVDQHGGTITADSSPGQGSTFTVSIPFGSEHLPSRNVRTEAVPEAPHAGSSVRTDLYVEQASRWVDAFASAPRTGEHHAVSKRVLLADDNADMREYIGRVLGEQFEVEAVADGNLALQAARTNPPDLIVADVMMPELNGLGLLRELRASEATRAIPVILLSARAGEEAKIEGLEGGADDYLVKPFSARELMARANSAIKLSQIRARVAQHEERVRIARDLHDTLLQSMQGLSFLLDAGLEKLKTDREAATAFFRNAMQASVQAVTEGRQVLSLLRSTAPERSDLTDGLQRLAGMQLGDGMRFVLNVVGEQRELLPKAWAEVYAICREALANAARHSGARSVALEVKFLEDLELALADDGCGMSAALVSDGRENHFGLQGMRERALKLGARLAFEGGPGRGTTVRLTVPGTAAYADER